MADDDNSSLMKEFEEFLSAKKAKEAEDAAGEDFDVEIWDEKGRGVRTKRSHAKPFLQSLGLDPDPPKADDKKDDDTKDNKGKARPAGKTAGNATASGIATKYFTRDKKPA